MALMGYGLLLLCCLLAVCGGCVPVLLLQKWEHATLPGVSDVFAEVLGPGDPMSAAEAYWMQLAVTLQQSSGPTGGGGVAGACVV